MHGWGARRKGGARLRPRAPLQQLEAAAADIPQLLACFLIAGESDYILRVAARDVADFGRVHSEYLSSLPHVLRMESSFILREVFNRSLTPILD